MTKRNYINPSIIAGAMKTLEKYKAENQQRETPLYDVAKCFDARSKAAFVRAAQRLKWNVTRSKGHVYENGYFIW